jgi:hypothetical protein
LGGVILSEVSRGSISREAQPKDLWSVGHRALEPQILRLRGSAASLRMTRFLELMTLALSELGGRWRLREAISDA